MRALADRFGFVWISDTAEAVGARFGQAHAGYGADFTILSFNGNKIITTSGGGALCCNDPQMADRARFLSTQARDPAPYYEHSTFGYNYRLSGVCAAIGVGQLEVLKERVEARRAIHATYQARLSALGGFYFHSEPEGSYANRWLTTIEIDPETGISPEALRLALEAHNIESRPLWKPMHLQPVFASAVAMGGDKAARAFERGLCLPSGSAMSTGDVDRVCDLIEQAMA
jgi:pyridoxal phosphate-dependent aminotransferase EpsN